MKSKFFRKYIYIKIIYTSITVSDISDWCRLLQIIVIIKKSTKYYLTKEKLFQLLIRWLKVLQTSLTSMTAPKEKNNQLTQHDFQLLL